MTLEQLESIPRDYLIPTEIAAYLHVYPQNLRERIRTDGNVFGIPAMITGKMIKVPKIPFIKFMKGEIT